MLVSLEPAAEGISIKVDSVVFKQWGDSIKALAADMLDKAGVREARLEIRDRGALECTLRARLETVLGRACRA